MQGVAQGRLDLQRLREVGDGLLGPTARRQGQSAILIRHRQPRLDADGLRGVGDGPGEVLPCDVDQRPVVERGREGRFEPDGLVGVGDRSGEVAQRRSGVGAIVPRLRQRGLLSERLAEVSDGRLVVAVSSRVTAALVPRPGIVRLGGGSGALRNVRGEGREQFVQRRRLRESLGRRQHGPTAGAQKSRLGRRLVTVDTGLGHGKHLTGPGLVIPDLDSTVHLLRPHPFGGAIDGRSATAKDSRGNRTELWSRPHVPLAIVHPPRRLASRGRREDEGRVPLADEVVATHEGARGLPRLARRRRADLHQAHRHDHRRARPALGRRVALLPALDQGRQDRARTASSSSSRTARAASRTRSSSTTGRNLSGIAVGFGGVYLCSVPKLIFIPMKDDKPAGKAEVLLDGWSLKTQAQRRQRPRLGAGRLAVRAERHPVARRASARPARPTTKRVPIDCGVWRYHPVTKTFEAVAWGTTNPWGLDWDDHGEMFITNCVIKHIFHVVPGGHYVRMYGQDLNPHTYGLIESCADHIHWGGGDWTDSRGGKGKHDAAGGGHAHAGAMFYLGDTWPKEYRNRVFMCNIHGNRVNMDRLERRGSGYVDQALRRLPVRQRPWFRGLTLKHGPDGGVYVSDWHDTGECHNYDKTHPSGRIYKVDYGKPKAVDADLEKATDAELVKLQGHAQRLVGAARPAAVLQERAVAGKLSDDVAPALWKMVQAEKDAGAAAAGAVGAVRRRRGGRDEAAGAAGRRGRARPRLGGAAAGRSQEGVEGGGREADGAGEGGEVGDGAAGAGVGAAAARAQGPLGDRRGAGGARRGRQRPEPAADDLVRHRGGGAGRPGEGGGAAGQGEDPAGARGTSPGGWRRWSEGHAGKRGPTAQIPLRIVSVGVRLICGQQEGEGGERHVICREIQNGIPAAGRDSSRRRGVCGNPVLHPF